MLHHHYLVIIYYMYRTLGHTSTGEVWYRSVQYDTVLEALSSRHVGHPLGCYSISVVYSYSKVELRQSIDGTIVNPGESRRIL